MNFIEKLLAQHCPDGVEFKNLGELGEFYGGLSGKTKEHFKNGNARYISYKNIFQNLAVALDCDDFVSVEEGEKHHTLKFGDILFTGSSETPNECGMSSVVTKEPCESIYLNSFCFGFRFDDENLFLPDFSKYLFRIDSIRRQIIRTANGTTRFNISKKKMAGVQIPLPPLIIQEEIVKILDTFTELPKELQKELELRQKQYTYYRDKLLSEEELSRLTEKHAAAGLCPSTSRVEFKPLSEVFTIKGGYTPSKAKAEFWEGGTIPWFRMDDIRTNGRILSDSLQHITPQAVKSGGLFPANSIIIATTATIGEHALIIVDYLSNQRFDCLIPKDEFTERINMKFMFYYGFILGEFCKKNVNKAAFPSVNKDVFKTFPIPLPPLSVQNEIVEILDKFDALAHSLSEGLPTEIKARKKQYEYYREKLLSFKEKELQK